jgi:hypothetical protein
MSGSTIKPWNKLVRLREDVRTGDLSLHEFAADLFDVVNRTGQRPLYEQPARFFPLTFATASLREIVGSVAERLRGKSAKAIRRFEQTYGGGKTHLLVTVTHIYRDPDNLPDVPAVRKFETAMGGSAPKARVHRGVLRQAGLGKAGQADKCQHRIDGAFADDGAVEVDT